MIDDTLNKIEQLIAHADHLSEKDRNDLKDLANELKHHIQQVPNVEHAQSTAGFAQQTTFEYLRADQNPELIALAERGMMHSVEEYEVSHPSLYRTLQSFVFALRGLGV